uniref:Uncharacterized protein n=1 Tax=Romanomermis culicivorax TaxID=13658 RepID=A0A915IQ53_ROMCU
MAASRGAAKITKLFILSRWYRAAPLFSMDRTTGGHAVPRSTMRRFIHHQFEKNFAVLRSWAVVISMENKRKFKHYNSYLHRHIIRLHQAQLDASAIVSALKHERILVHRQGVSNLIQQYILRRNLDDASKKGRPNSVKLEIKEFIESKLQNNNELTNCKITMN